MTIVEDAEVVSAVPKRRMTLERREALNGFAFLSPWFVGLAIFTAVPILMSFVISFTDLDPRNVDKMRFIGLDNYANLFRDATTVNSFLVTLKFAVVSVPLGLAIALGLAMLLNQKLLAGKRVFRTLFFLPVQIPLVASTIVWLDVLNGSNGWLKYFIEAFTGAVGHIPGLGFVGNYIAPDWLNDVNWAVPALIVMGIWGVGNAMLIFLAGLQSVPTELYEAARVDGAGPVRQFWNVTIPMISPVFFYNLLLAVIGASQYFVQPYVISGCLGNPGNQTYVYNINLYCQAWKYQRMGFGTTLAWLMFAIVLVASVLLFRTSARWVFYAGENR